jgi:hypothetical protein
VSQDTRLSQAFRPGRVIPQGALIAVAKSQAVRPLDLPAVSTRTLVLAAAVVAGLLLLAYLVAFDQGAISRSGMFLHELMHDGRHLLGVPCH